MSNRGTPEPVSSSPQARFRWLMSAVLLPAMGAPVLAFAQPQIGEAYVVEDEGGPKPTDTAPDAPRRMAPLIEPDTPGRPVAFFKQLWRERTEARNAGAGSVADRKLEIMLAA